MFTTAFINIANQRNSGIDVSLTYSHAIGRGKLTLETEHTFQSIDSGRCSPRRRMTSTAAWANRNGSGT